MKIILFNGPPGCGKDTAARTIYNRWSELGLLAPPHFDRFSMPLKRTFALLVGAKCNQFGIVSPYEDNKEVPVPFLNGASYRQFQIDLSEKLMKPLYGPNIFANLLIERLCLANPEVAVIPDCGFQQEVDCLLKEFSSTALIRIMRPGCNFKNDSRDYVRPRLYSHFASIDNNGTEADFQQMVIDTIKPFLQEGK